MERLTPLPWQGELWTQLIGWRDRLPHALLVHGTRGIGKRHLIKAFARLLLCESPKGESPCGQCAGCQLLSADNHPDLRWLTPAAQMPERDDAGVADGEAETGSQSMRSASARPGREIVIDQVRKTGEFLSITSHRGGRRVVLLIPAEALNEPAANALLKTLEEPPPEVVFLAVSDELDAVLPTIRSRFLLLRAPVPRQTQALDWLQRAGVDDAARKLAEAGGAPIGLLEGDSPQEGRMLDSTLREELLNLLARGSALTAAEVASVVPKDIPVAAAIRLLQRWGWDLLAERMAGRVRYYPMYQRIFATLARGIEPSRVADWAATLAQTQAVSDHPLNARLVVESALLGYIDAMRERNAMRV
ncbi:MAG: DNA polymerase III subunit delta' [Burkholderiaceae bacterium]